MQRTGLNHSPQKDRSQRQKRRSRWVARLLAWARFPAFGYFASALFIGTLLLIEKVDQYVPQSPLFTGTPFAMVSILAALLWGTGPALFAFVLGLIALATFVSPSIFTLDPLMEASIFVPFIVLQLIAIAAVIVLERSHRGLLVAHRELEVAHQKLFQETRLKDYIITRASHELRTPLTTILGRTQLLASHLDKSGEIPENWATVRKYIAVVEVRALHLRALLDSLFDLSRARAEEISFPLPPCDLKSLCRDVVENQRMISGRLIELEFPADEVVIPADDKRLSQVLENLVSNAVKYSPQETTIQVRVSLEGTHVMLQVHNECPTLSPEQVEHLFEPFYRPPEVEYSPIPGWGLGLTISKAIVERHGGQIWAEFSTESGITFFVTLPLGRDIK